MKGEWRIMKRLRTIGLCLVAVLALSSLVVSTATARDFWVNGKVLASGKANGKEVEIVSNSTIYFTIKTPSVQIACEKLEMVREGSHPIIWNEAKGTEAVGRDDGQLDATKCRDVTSPSCTVVEPIKTDNTSEVSTTLVEEKGTSGKKIYDMFLPEKWVEGTSAESEKELPFSTFDQTGTGCVTGVVIEGDGLAAKISSETEELEKHTIQLPGEATNCTPVGAPITPVVMANGNQITLRFKGILPAQECGEATVRLTSKEAWSVK
jgi:hypothetical protein